MSAIVSVEDASKQTEYKVLTKGAPEVVRKLLKSVPANYDKAYLKYVKDGARVLVLASKTLPKAAPETYVSVKRDEAECELTFCGFIVSECPLKPDTKRVINELKVSRHMVKMITGDN
jgi:manganese-transporting P-type ATPase